jgi:hypothetical protein
MSLAPHVSARTAMLTTRVGEHVADAVQHLGVAGQDLGIAAEAQRAIGQAGLGVDRAVVDAACGGLGRDQGEVGVLGRPRLHPRRPWAEHEVVHDRVAVVAHHLLLDHQRRVGGIGEVGDLRELVEMRAALRKSATGRS